MDLDPSSTTLIKPSTASDAENKLLSIRAAGELFNVSDDLIPLSFSSFVTISCFFCFASFKSFPLSCSFETRMASTKLSTAFAALRNVDSSPPPPPSWLSSILIGQYPSSTRRCRRISISKPMPEHRHGLPFTHNGWPMDVGHMRGSTSYKSTFLFFDSLCSFLIASLPASVPRFFFVLKPISLISSLAIFSARPSFAKRSIRRASFKAVICLLI
mmetsp:Transcript_4474/g.8725  ORF Transcript_4474/g.8725 Transcript_4474/m.8725 type:complete len:215 (+) Transcript_4474:1205-1849(+)